MKKTAGFTLIELVIVIVILGILGAVAAPRFLNLQGDAYAANVKSLAGSLQSAATLAHTKAILEGEDGATAAEGAVDGYPTIEFKNGFPKAANDSSGILGALQNVPAGYKFDTTTAGSLIISPTARTTNCNVTYIEAKGKNEPAKIEYETSGCD